MKLKLDEKKTIVYNKMTVMEIQSYLQNNPNWD